MECDIKRLKELSSLEPNDSDMCEDDILVLTGAVYDIERFQKIVAKIPSLDEITTALAANGSMIKGEIVHRKDLCQCDPSVGVCPCMYCAVHDVLIHTHAARVLIDSAPI